MGKNTGLFERKEVKYLITDSNKNNLMELIGEFLEPDEYSRYSISNVYMDTSDGRLIRRSMEKPVYKEKMRLRSYGAVRDDQKVYVELKKKYKGIVYKRRIAMPLSSLRGFLEGKEKNEGQIEGEIGYFLKFYRDIAPAMFISYDREAYHGRDDKSLRITFDKNIHWREEDLSLSSEAYGAPLLKDHQVLMEIKCAGAMPLWLTGALSENRIYRTSFSKYGMAYTQKMTCPPTKAVGL